MSTRRRTAILVAVAHLAAALLVGLFAVGAFGTPNRETTLPADGVTSIERTGDTWVLTFTGPPSEVKIMDPVNRPLCGRNYPQLGACGTTLTVPAISAPCTYWQVDGIPGANSSDPYVCRPGTPPTSPTPTVPTPSVSTPTPTVPTPTVTTPSPTTPTPTSSTPTPPVVTTPPPTAKPPVVTTPPPTRSTPTPPVETTDAPVPPSDEQPPTSTSTPTLPDTGGPPWRLATLGALLVAAGTFIVRRWRQEGRKLDDLFASLDTPPDR